MLFSFPCQVTMDALVSCASAALHLPSRARLRRRGVVLGLLALGVELKQNIKRVWWRDYNPAPARHDGARCLQS